MTPSPGTWKYSKDLSAVVVGRSDGTLKHVADLGLSDLPERDDNGCLLAASKDLYAFAEAFEVVIKSSGHNLCSTATEAERTAFITGILNAWNTNFPALDKARGK